MKNFFASTICLVLLMANNAFSIDDNEDRRDPTQMRLHQVNQNNARDPAGTPLTNYLPWNWTWQNRKIAGVVVTFGVICSIHILQNYIVNQREKARCQPYIDPQVFKDYNSNHHTTLDPTGILEQWGANVQNNPILFVLDTAYKSNEQFLFNLTNTTLNNSHLECHYSPTFDYRASGKSCGELSPNYQDISFNLTYKVSSLYNYWKNGGSHMRLFLYTAIPFSLMLYFSYLV